MMDNILPCSSFSGGCCPLQRTALMKIHTHSTRRDPTHFRSCSQPQILSNIAKAKENTLFGGALACVFKACLWTGLSPTKMCQNSCPLGSHCESARFFHLSCLTGLSWHATPLFFHLTTIPSVRVVLHETNSRTFVNKTPGAAQGSAEDPAQRHAPTTR